MRDTRTRCAGFAPVELPVALLLAALLGLLLFWGLEFVVGDLPNWGYWVVAAALPAILVSIGIATVVRERSSRPQEPDFRPQECTDRAPVLRAALDRGCDLEEAFAALRVAGASDVEAVQAVADVLHRSLEEADQMLDNSLVWQTSSL